MDKALRSGKGVLKMTRLELMQMNKKIYDEYSEKIKNMTGLEKLVAEKLV